MKKILLSFILLISLFTYDTFSQKSYKTIVAFNLDKTAGQPFRTKFNINNISTWVYSNGDQDIMMDGNSGFEYPKGSGKKAVFESGIIWGGNIGDKKHVSGSTYEQGLLPGKIFDDGSRSDPYGSKARVYRVRPDYTYSNLLTEIEDEEKSYEEVFNQYQLDWNEWPADWGAPFNDVDGDGIYNPNIDIPGVNGAHQTIWYVANDFDTAVCRSLYGCDPMKTEVQVTIWGYSMPSTPYDNIMFKKYKITNYNSVDIDSMYISQWSDDDIGDAGDDFVGVDTLLSLKYSYNGDDYDESYSYFNNGYGELIPSVGYQLLQGPIVKGSISDTAISGNEFITGYKNLDLSVHSFFVGSDPVFNDPNLGEYSSGALQFHNLFRGLITSTGAPFKDPITGEQTKFCLAGNPITVEGWNDGYLHPTGDRRSVMVMGPFKMSSGESQEIVIAQMAAIGQNRLNSVELLKGYAITLKNQYPNFSYFQLNPLLEKIHTMKPGIIHDKFNSYDIIELNILRNDTLEQFSEDGFEFQGYSIYQFLRESSESTSGKRIFIFDKKDNITTILGNKYDPFSNILVQDTLYEGMDSGFPDEIIIEKDYINNSELIKGKKYFYGISSYFYNRSSNEVVDGRLSTINIVFQEDLAGSSYLDTIEAKREIGISNAGIDIHVVDPYQLTGDTYEITFGEQHYYLNADGIWIKTTYPDSIGMSINKPVDQSKSKLVALPSIYSFNQTLDIHLLLELNSPDNNWCDGIKLTFPEGIKINSADRAGNNHIFSPTIEGRTIQWGYQDTTFDGGFSGGEDLTINIDYAEPTFAIEYEIFDDGWSKFYLDATGDDTYYNLGEGIVDGYGYVTLTGEIGYQFKTVKYWDLWNKSQNIQKLDEIEINSYAYSYYYGGGLFRYGPEFILDGFKIKFAGSFEPPKNFFNIDLKSPTGLSNLSTSLGIEDNSIAIVNYTIFGGTVSSLVIDNFGVGTTDVSMLQEDYELRFTGEMKNSRYINNQQIFEVLEGGQMATCFSMVNRDGLANHPLNPNPGSANPFLIRIPFEVWNVEDPNNEYQVNFVFRDRERDGTENPFWTWNLNERMYGIVVNSPYDPNQVIQIDDGPDNYNKNATWVVVFYSTNYHLNDTVKVEYFNPITYDDVYTFTTPEAPTDKISPNSHEIFQNYPNPFNPNTTIRYFIPNDGLVTIDIYNILGQKVLNLVNKEMKAGKYETEFNGSNLASGIYFYRIDSGNFTETKKMLLLK